MPDVQNSTLQNKVALIVVSDLHINSTVAICPPSVSLDDGGKFTASRLQRWLWSSWQQFWAGVNTDATGYRKVLVLNGDLGELDRKVRSAQLITQNKATILSMVRDVLDVATWDALYILRGTPAHTGRSSWLEEEIGKDFDAVQSDTDVHSWWHLRALVSGVRFDIAHHASMGKKPWTKPNSAVSLASEAIWNYKVERDADPPDVIVRSHNHTYIEGRVNNTQAYFTPCWTGITEYGYRVGYENTMPSIGGLVFYCDDCGWRMDKYMFKPEKERRVWALKI